MQQIQLTQEGLDKLKAELDELVMTKKPAMLDRLARARAMGDLRENSEYQAAREEQGFIEGRIRELEELIKRAVVVSQTADPDAIQVGSVVSVKTPNGKDTFTIVGEFEADPMNKKLSSGSPIGKALMGKKAGDTVEITVPAGTMLYEVLTVKNS